MSPESDTEWFVTPPDPVAVFPYAMLVPYWTEDEEGKLVVQVISALPVVILLAVTSEIANVARCIENWSMVLPVVETAWNSRKSLLTILILQ